LTLIYLKSIIEKILKNRERWRQIWLWDDRKQLLNEKDN